MVKSCQFLYRSGKCSLDKEMCPYGSPYECINYKVHPNRKDIIDTRTIEIRINESRFNKIFSGDQKYWICLNDKKFVVGDVLRFIMVDEDSGSTAMNADYIVSSVDDSLPGIIEGYVILGFRKVRNNPSKRS